MPSYLVERSIPNAGELTAVELEESIQQSPRVQQGVGSRIQWLQAAITADRMVCLYLADNEAIIREHGRLIGLPIQSAGFLSCRPLSGRRWMV